MLSSNWGSTRVGIASIGREKLRGRLSQNTADFPDFEVRSLAFSRFCRTELEKALVGRMEHEIDLLLPEPAQRRRRNPLLFQVVLRKYLASYLRMTPETLSRLR